MSAKQDRKLDELSVDWPAFDSVLASAKTRQEARVNLRAMIDRAGPDLRILVVRPGEIQRMVKDYREALRTRAEAGADEQAAELEAMLVEIRRRVEEGTLRSGRKASAKGTGERLDTSPESGIDGVEDRAPHAGVTKSGGGGLGSAAAEDSNSEGVEKHVVAAPDEAPKTRAEVQNAGQAAADDGSGQPQSLHQAAKQGAGEPAGDEPESDDELDESGGEATKGEQRASDWQKRPGVGGDHRDTVGAPGAIAGGSRHG